MGVLGLRGFPHVMGGVERHCEHLYPEIAKKGFEFIVCRRTPYLNEMSKDFKIPGITFLDIWTPRNKHLEALIHSLISIVILRLRGVKIVHIHSFGPAMIAPIARLLGQKVIMTYHLPNYMQGKWNRMDQILLRSAERIACKWSNKIIAVSENNQRLIKTNTGKDSVVIYNGITPSTTKNNSVESFGLKKGKYIFAACRFVPEKGLHTLIEAFEKIDTDWNLVIAGDADHSSEYSEKLKRMAEEDSRILLTGFVSGERLESLFACAGLFVLPSHIEGLPIALLEAMSFGVPVVVSDIPPHRDLHLSENSYFTPGDVLTLAKTMENKINDKEARIEASKLKDEIKDKYNWETIASETADVICSV